MNETKLIPYVLDGREYMLPKTTHPKEFWDALRAQIPEPQPLDPSPEVAQCFRRICKGARCTC